MTSQPQCQVSVSLRFLPISCRAWNHMSEAQDPLHVPLRTGQHFKDMYSLLHSAPSMNRISGLTHLREWVKERHVH